MTAVLDRLAAHRFEALLGNGRGIPAHLPAPGGRDLPTPAATEMFVHFATRRLASFDDGPWKVRGAETPSWCAVLYYAGELIAARVHGIVLWRDDVCARTHSLAVAPLLAALAGQDVDLRPDGLELMESFATEIANHRAKRGLPV